MNKNQSMENRKIGILITDFKVHKEYKEILTPALINHGMKVIYIFSSQNNLSRSDNRFLIKNRLARFTHSLYHDSVLWKNRESNISYKFRAIGKFGSIAQRNFYSNNFLPHILPEPFLNRIIIRITSTKIILNLMKKYLYLVAFHLKSSHYKSNFNNIDILLIPYGARISIEEDFAIWLAKKLNIKSVAVQENWDNLSSKKFMFSQPDYFITWGKQSTGHLKKFQKYEGKIKEFGCIRMQQFYKYKSELIKSQRRRNKSKNNVKKDSRIILFIGNGTVNDIELIDFLVDYAQKQVKYNNKNTFFIFRPHPFSRVDLSKQLHKIENKKIIVDIPKKSESNDYRLKLIKNSEVVVGFYSTVLLEALIMDKVVAIPSFLGHDSRYKAFNFLSDSPHYNGINQLRNLYNFDSPKDLGTFLNYTPKLMSDPKSYNILNKCCADIDTVNAISKFLFKLI